MKVLISVYEKEGLKSFGEKLVASGAKIIATPGTHRYLQENGVAAKCTSSITGFEELLDGKIKTLHPALHAEISEGKISMVVVNLMPIEREDKNPLKNMDIGGVSLIRSGVKHYEDVLVIVSPQQYGDVAERLIKDNVFKAMKQEYAKIATEYIIEYEMKILSYLVEK